MVLSESFLLKVTSVLIFFFAFLGRFCFSDNPQNGYICCISVEVEKITTPCNSSQIGDKGRFHKIKIHTVTSRQQQQISFQKNCTIFSTPSAPNALLEGV